MKPQCRSLSEQTLKAALLAWELSECVSSYSGCCIELYPLDLGPCASELLCMWVSSLSGSVLGPGSMVQIMTLVPLTLSTLLRTVIQANSHAQLVDVVLQSGSL